MGQRNVWVKKMFASKKFMGQKIYGLKDFWVKKIFGQKNFSVKKIGQKDLGPIFFGQNEPGRVNPRWRIYYTPAPQKTVGLKLCWIVVSFAW